MRVCVSVHVCVCTPAYNVDFATYAICKYAYVCVKARERVCEYVCMCTGMYVYI